MTKFEKVIKGLECCKTDPSFESDCEDKGCPYKTDLMQCINHLCADALELLKEQKPIPCGEKIKAGDVMLDFYKCGYCKNAIRKPWKYCPFCGKEVKWDG